MPKFYFKVKGSASDHFSAGVVTATDEDDAKQKVNTTYGITKDVQQVELEYIDADAFNKLEAERGNELTNKVE